MLKEQEPNKLSLQITQHNEQVEVRAEAPGGQAKSESALPSDSIVNRTIGIHPRELSQDDVDKIGNQLYQLLTNGNVGKLVFDALDDGKRSSQSLFLELRFDADQISLTKYPWELIRNELGEYLVRDSLIDLTRCITYPQPMPVLRDNIRDATLLRIISRPPTLSPITTVELALKNIETIDHAAFSTLQKKLLIEKVNSWGLQFDGHGALLLKCSHCRQLNELTSKKCSKCSRSLIDAKQIGVLAFENNGDADLVTTDEFGSVLYNSGVQLAMLLACESARGGDESIFSSLASNLILSGVPAVIGMQYPVLDKFANSFANTFYTVLLEKGNLLEAVRSARRMNIRGEWYNPSVYLRYKPSQIISPVYDSRQIDTATPSEVIAGDSFLVGLWIRRQSSPQLSQTEVRKQLCISDDVEVIVEVSEADIRFEKVEGRKIRRGELTVKIQSTGSDEQARILFVDENRDAPSAIFVVKAIRTGKLPILFNIYQDERLIASLSHTVSVVEFFSQKAGKIQTTSNQILIEKDGLEKSSNIADERKLEAKKIENIEITLCLDITGSMGSILGMLREKVLILYEGIRFNLEQKGTNLNSLRVRVVAFRDYTSDEIPLVETPFFNLPSENDGLANYLKSLKVDGGGDEPESGLEGLYFGIASDWSKATTKMIVLWTDAAPHPLGNNKMSHYPSGIPHNLSELETLWLQISSPKRLILICPQTVSWANIYTKWEDAIHIPYNNSAPENNFNDLLKIINERI